MIFFFLKANVQHVVNICRIHSHVAVIFNNEFNCREYIIEMKDPISVCENVPHVCEATSIFTSIFIKENKLKRSTEAKSLNIQLENEWARQQACAVHTKSTRSYFLVIK